jgi:hypothetical protein
MPRATLVSFDNPCVPDAKRRDTRDWRERHDTQALSLVHRRGR